MSTFGVGSLTRREFLLTGRKGPPDGMMETGRRLKIGAGAAAMLLALACAPATAEAADILTHVGDLTVPAGTVVHGDAIAIGGSVDVEGTVEGDAIATGGSVTVGGRVTGSAWSMAGNVRLRSTAVVGGSVAAWGGQVIREPGASVGGGSQAPIPGVPPSPLPMPVPGTPYPAPGSPWGWLPGIFGLLAAFHVFSWLIVFVGLAGFVVGAWLTAILFPGTLTALAGDLERAPVAAFVIGLIGWLALWPVIVLLAMSVIGLAFVLLIPSAIVIMLQFGTTAVALLTGRRIRRGSLGREALVGSVVLSIAFAVPHLGWLVAMAVLTLGWGVVLLALFDRIRAHRVPPPPAPV